MLRKMTKVLAGLAVALMIPGLACMTDAAKPQPASIPVTTGEAAADAVDAQTPTGQDGEEGAGGAGGTAAPGQQDPTWEDHGEMWGMIPHDRPGKPDTITTTGAGRATAAADVIRIHLSALQDDQDAAAALEDVTKTAAAITAEADRLGVAPEDISTVGLTVTEKMEYEPSTRQWERRGYAARQRTLLKVQDTGQAGRILGGVIEAGNQAGTGSRILLDGVSTDIQDRTALRLEAVAAAARNMWDQAERIALASGREICSLLETRAPILPGWPQNG